MKKILVNIVWNDNYGAYSDLIPGCVATHATIDGVKEAYKSALEFHIEGSEDDDLPECLKEEYELEYELSVLTKIFFILSQSRLFKNTYQ